MRKQTRQGEEHLKHAERVRTSSCLRLLLSPLNKIASLKRSSKLLGRQLSNASGRWRAPLTERNFGQFLWAGVEICGRPVVKMAV